MISKRKDLPSKKNKKKNFYKNPKNYNEFLEKLRGDERSTEDKKEIPNFDFIRQNSTDYMKQKIEGTNIDRLALKMLMQIQIAIMKYIKDNS